MKFLVVQRQSGGCDYTIGCGVAVSVVEADDMQAAIVSLKSAAFSDDPGTYDLLSTHEGKRSRVQIFEIGEEMEIPLGEWRAERLRHEADHRASATEATERRQLEALRAKYG